MLAYEPSLMVARASQRGFAEGASGDARAIALRVVMVVNGRVGAGQVLNALIAALAVALAPQISLAQTMSLPGSFSVGTSGTATYNIPIAVPPGAAGLAPSLSLEYSLVPS